MGPTPSQLQKVKFPLGILRSLTENRLAVGHVQQSAAQCAELLSESMRPSGPGAPGAEVVTGCVAGRSTAEGQSWMVRDVGIWRWDCLHNAAPRFQTLGVERARIFNQPLLCCMPPINPSV